jgi:RNA recognition motif-containing protein
VTSAKLYVGNLSFDATESDLFELFKGVGAVRNAEIVTNKFNEKSKGFGFVMMSSVDEAKRAVVELHDKEFLGRKLVVSGANRVIVNRIIEGNPNGHEFVEPRRKAGLLIF